MVEIILVRHGETEWNKSEIFRGRVDLELNESGLHQAERLGAYLSGEKIDFIYSSPLRRAVQTAEAISRYQQVQVQPVSSLIDIDFGEWQGLTAYEVADKYPDENRDWLDTPEQVRIPGGESLADVRNRVMPFLEDAVLRCGEGKLVIVTHNAVLKVLICALLGLSNASFQNIELDTCGITRFQFEGNRTVLYRHNDTSFLSDER